MSSTTPRRSSRQEKTTEANYWPRGHLRQTGLQLLSVALSVAVGYALLLAPAMVSQLGARTGQASAVITVTPQGQPLDPADIEALTRALPSALVSRNLAPQSIPTPGASFPTSVEAVDSTFFAVYGLKLLGGRFFTSWDDLQANPVAVIGQQTAETYFSRATAAIGKSLRVRNVSLTVIGVLAQPAAADLTGLSQRVFVPLQTGRIRLLGAQAPIELAIGTDDAAEASDLAVSASHVLAQRYPSAASTFLVRIHVESGFTESIIQLLARAASGVHVDFLQTKHLVPQPAEQM